jgi:hypothetical protein
VGIGLRSPHVSEIAATRPELAFLEVLLDEAHHAEELAHVHRHVDTA